MLIRLITIILDLYGKVPQPFKHGYGSPPEEKFHKLAFQAGIELSPQASITELGMRRPDFYVTGTNIIIEIDSFQWHSSRDKLLDDRCKDRVALTQGFITVRYMATEIRDNPYAVIDNLKLVIQKWKTQSIW